MTISEIIDKLLEGSISVQEAVCIQGDREKVVENPPKSKGKYNPPRRSNVVR